MKGKSWRKRCVWCDQIVPMRKAQRYCSPTCARYGGAIVVPDARRQAIGRHAGLASGAVRHARMLARIAAEVEALDPVAAFQLGYAKGYSAGQKRRTHKTVDSAAQLG